MQVALYAMLAGVNAKRKKGVEPTFLAADYGALTEKSVRPLFSFFVSDYVGGLLRCTTISSPALIAPATSIQPATPRMRLACLQKSIRLMGSPELVVCDFAISSDISLQGGL